MYYLNEEWNEEDGGKLRIYSKKGDKKYFDLAPMLDTLIIFRSQDVEHEVLPTFHQRMALTIWYYSPPPPIKNVIHRNKKNTIFLSIPSYRDPECEKTILDLFHKAKTPENIYIGVCLQYNEELDKDLTDFFDTKMKALQYYQNIRVTKMKAEDAKGPCLARAETQKLYMNEEYYLQIDSHMR